MLSLADMSARADGFSLVELLVSMAIVAVLYALALGPGSSMVQSNRKTQCAQQLARIHQSLALFAAEHDGAFPAVSGATTSEIPLSLLVPLYTTDTSIFICPGSKDADLPGAQPFADRRISYAYYMGLKNSASPTAPLASDAQASLDSKRPGSALFSTSGSPPGDKHRTYGGNILFVDGHVETLPALAPREFPIPAGAALLNPKSR